MREWHLENQIGKENHFEYRSIQKIGSAKSYILNTEEYRQESTVLHIEDVTLVSVPKRVGGAGGGPSGLRNSEMAFPLRIPALQCDPRSHMQ